MRSSHPLAPASLLLAAALAGPVAATAQEADASYSCTTVMESELCASVHSRAGSATLEVTIPLALIEAVPADAEMTWPPQQLAVVDLPAEARTAFGIDHLGVNWEAHGHPPGPFMVPHFDFHFYNITVSQVHAIDCMDTSKPASLPPGYTLPDVDIPGMGTLVGLCVPQMGMHAMADDDLALAEPFEANMIVGYYAAEPIYFEPMIARERLLERSNFALDIPAVEHLPVGVSYPNEFRAEYDAESDGYRFVITGFAR